MDDRSTMSVSRSRWRGFRSAAIIILGVAGVHFASVLLCFAASIYESDQFRPISFLGMGGNPVADQRSTALSWMGILGGFALSFPLGTFFCCIFAGQPKLFFAATALNSLFWGWLVNLRVQFVKHMR